MDSMAQRVGLLRRGPILCLLFVFLMPAWPVRPTEYEWLFRNKDCMLKYHRLPYQNVQLFASSDDQNPDGAVKEGAAVSLRCPIYCRDSDKMPFMWFRNGVRLPTNTSEIHLNSVSIQDSGNYTCAVVGYDGYHTSLPVTLNVRYTTMDVSVSIRPSAEVVEGSSVTLTCSSTSNPTVKYTWFKGILPVAQGQQYNISRVRVEDSGEYMCHISNENKQAYATKTLTVTYSPKVVSVSVTLTCNADAEPPVRYYSWFKEGEASPVAFGQSFNIANILEEDISEYYCEAQNSIGHHSMRLAPSVSHKGECSTALGVAAGIGGCCGAVAAAVLLTSLWIRSKKKKTSIKEDDNVGPDAKDDTYTELDPKSRSSNDVYTNLRIVHSRAPNGTTKV